MYQKSNIQGDFHCDNENDIHKHDKVNKSPEIKRYNYVTGAYYSYFTPEKFCLN